MTSATDQLEKLVQGNAPFALDLYHSFRKACPGNLFFSPFSVSACLAMALLGARGNTASQMARGLRLGVEDSETHAKLAAIQEALLQDGGKSNVELRIANRLWTHRGFPVLSPFINHVDRYYRGGFQEVDFSKSQEVCRLINDWVNKMTNAMIPEIVSEGQIRDALLVLANAIYFRGKWSTPFEKEATEPRPFYLSSGKDIEVLMMEQRAAGWYARVPNLQILEKRYGEGGFSMVILLPDRYDGLESLEATLSSKNLDAWLAMLRGNDEIDIQLPKFRIESNPPLKLALIEMGMADVFDAKKADFSGITGKQNLFINEAIHKAVIEVEEEGTRAAAATLFTLCYGATPDPRPRLVFHVDRPFMFLIRHNPSKTILFLGRVVDPR